MVGYRFTLLYERPALHIYLFPILFTRWVCHQQTVYFVFSATGALSSYWAGLLLNRKEQKGQYPIKNWRTSRELLQRLFHSTAGYYVAVLPVCWYTAWIGCCVVVMQSGRIISSSNLNAYAYELLFWNSRRQKHESRTINGSKAFIDNQIQEGAGLFASNIYSIQLAWLTMQTLYMSSSKIGGELPFSCKSCVKQVYRVSISRPAMFKGFLKTSYHLLT